MPRDGSNTYRLPFPNVDPSTTIASAVYNGFTNDVATDLNLPRPISAGGTGASDAATAITNLGGEAAKQAVSNYDSFAFLPGSFTSLAGATSAPTANAAFGVYYENANSSYATLSAHDQVTGFKYTRSKVANVWAGWRGETFGGDVGINKATPSLVLSKTATTGQDAIIAGYTNTNLRWLVDLADASNEAGSNAGSNFTINRYSDAGAFLNQPFHINRATGNVSITGTLISTVVTSAFNLKLVESTGGWTKGIRVVNGGNLEFVNNANTLVIGSLSDVGVFNTSGSHYIGGRAVLSNDGSYTDVYDGSGTVATFITGNSGDPINYYRNTSHLCQDRAGTQTFWQATSAAVNIFTRTVVQPLTTSISTLNCALNVGYLGGASQFGMALRPLTDTTTAIAFVSTGNTVIGSITQTGATVAYNTTSDIRLKEDLAPFDAGAIIDRIGTYRFKWRGSDERGCGVVAQEVAPIFPEAVTHNAEQDWWGVDYSKFVPLLLQEIKALRERVKALEVVEAK